MGKWLFSHAGPDELAAADSYMTWLGSEAVKLYVEGSGPASETPISVMTALKQTVKKSAHHPALCKSHCYERMQSNNSLRRFLFAEA